MDNIRMWMFSDRDAFAYKWSNVKTLAASKK